VRPPLNTLSSAPSTSTFRIDEVVTKVIRGSNFSNQFDKSQLWAPEPFHKELEVFFESLEGDRKLFYERRKGQFSATIGVEKVRIVTPIALLKATASIFLERPHDVTKYYTSLEPEVGHSIFVHGHNLPVSGCGLCRVSAGIVIQIQGHRLYL
jgi:AIPR protein